MKFRSFRNHSLHKRAMRRLIRQTTVRRRVVKNVVNRINSLKQRLRTSNDRDRKALRRRIVILRRKARIIRR